MLEHGNGVAIRPRAFCTVLIPGQVPQQSATSLCSCCTNSRLAAALRGCAQEGSASYATACLSAARGDSNVAGRRHTAEHVLLAADLDPHTVGCVPLHAGSL